MPVEIGNQPIGGIKKLEKYLPEESREELRELLIYGEKMKKEGEKLEQAFRESHSREDFLKLLQGMNKRVGKYGKYLTKMSKLERKKFVEEYLYDKIIYTGNIYGSKYEKTLWRDDEKLGFDQWLKKVKYQIKPGMNIDFDLIGIGLDGVEKLAREWKDSLQLGMSISLYGNSIGYNGIETLAKEWKDSLKPGMKIDLSGNNLGLDGIDFLAKEWKNSLKPGMEICLNYNEIGSEGAKVIAENMELKEGVNLCLKGNEIGNMGSVDISTIKLKSGVILDLSENKIGNEGGIAISKNMKLEKGVTLDLQDNKIGNKGALAIMKNMELKEGANLLLSKNKISDDMRQKMIERVKSYEKRGINSKIIF